ncbi:hypothetical protein BOX15_Mlig026250g5 [Macrostomum lignano]|uniref:Protein-tyrosine-phosphatase n=1 Tax=Macrostomum lignano TaxID=282301 RepID=A0A267G0Z1_9PLAT|nr:hypothetical protein BOX15_Mlig026250g5 [Macrostomum lignano]
MPVPLSWDAQPAEFQHMLKGLDPNKLYTIRLTARFPNREASAEVACPTASAPPRSLQAPIAIDKDVDRRLITLRLRRASDRLGVVQRYLLVVAPEAQSATSQDLLFQRSDLETVSVDARIASSKEPYIAACFTAQRFRQLSSPQSAGYIEFQLGTKLPTETCDSRQQALNKPLLSDASYKSFLAACLSPAGSGPVGSLVGAGCSYSPWSEAFGTHIALPSRSLGTAESGYFTLIIVLVTSALGLTAVVCISVGCIALGCFVCGRKGTERGRNFRNGSGGHSNNRQPMQVLVEPSLKQPLIPASQQNSTSFCATAATGGTLQSVVGSATLQRQQQQQQQQQQQFGTLQSSSHVGTLPTLSIRSASSSAAFHQGPTDPVELRRINFQTPALTGHPPVPVAQLIDHVASLKASDNLKFSAEYESIDPGQQFTWENSNLDVNKPKNRYANVIAYDHSRVVLQPLDGLPGSDYINANYMDGYRRQNAYIATQGPLPDTIGDFWRMIWEQKTSTVVMMTRLEERSRVKCDMYWPNKGSEVFDYMTVSLLDTLELAYYTIRTFALHRAGATEKREIHHFQFTAWPDHGVPEHCAPLLMFARRVHASNPPDAGPIVAHCSAGVGRTGAFIVIDAMLERMKQEKTLDVYGHVTCLRAQRNYMVQTEDQYIFIHDCLLEAVICGNTEVPARALAAQVQRLSIPEPAAGGATGMELEFRSLAHTVKPTPAHKFTSASLPANKLKNRLVNILPFESNRVCLQPIRGVEGSDYINASWIDGYRQRSCYIATQGPLPDTAEDFWRMLWEHNSTIVVNLTKLREQGRDKCHQYWPGERSARYQYFVVDPMAEYNMPNYILREFKVTDARDGQSRTVRQFHCTDWPEQGVPKSGEGFIEFIGQVHKTKEQFGQDGPITVHCSAGVGRTGVFLALSVVLERMRYEGVVDMYQTVRTLRTQRSAMVQTDEQYQFCYGAALEYLSSFDHYAT